MRVADETFECEWVKSKKSLSSVEKEQLAGVMFLKNNCDLAEWWGPLPATRLGLGQTCAGL